MTEPDAGQRAPSKGGRRLRRACLAVAVASLAAGVSLTACGGSGPTSSTTPAGSSGSNGSPSSSYQLALKFAQCMRTHGVPDFPDPTSSGQFAIRNGSLDTQSQQFKTAQNNCKSYAPAPPSQAQQAQTFAGALKFAQCMRSHGIPDFPDPKQNSNGTVSGNVVGANTPQFQTASQACQKYFTLPGGGGNATPGS